MPDSDKVAIVAALEREVRPLVKYWHITQREFSGRRFKFFENEHAVLVCGGIGAAAARRATEAIISLYQPSLVESVGFAGALDPALRVGHVFVPRRVIDAQDGSSTDTGAGNGVLVSVVSVASTEQKTKLAKAHSAQAVDMEAAAVARGAQARGVRFTAVKAISDEMGFVMPPMERFIHHDGQFRATAFVVFAAARPWLWPRVIQLARNTARASHALCAWLQQHHRAAGIGEASNLQPVASRER